MKDKAKQEPSSNSAALTGIFIVNAENIQSKSFPGGVPPVITYLDFNYLNDHLAGTDLFIRLVSGCRLDEKVFPNTGSTIVCEPLSSAAH
ncbi:hypothetical protein ACMFMG_004205 [Clarireedia jacksonii]